MQKKTNKNIHAYIHTYMKMTDSMHVYSFSSSSVNIFIYCRFPVLGKLQLIWGLSSRLYTFSSGDSASSTLPILG